MNFFADDSMIYSICDDPITTSSDLNHDLGVIGDWAKQWKMSFNPDVNKQAVEVLFSHKTRQNQHPPLIFNNMVVKKVKEHKHLGLILDSKLIFSEQKNEKIMNFIKIMF